MRTQHIVFIHGLFMNPKSWSHWISYFTQLGYICHAPAYPYHDGEPSTLRARYDARLSTVTLQQVISTYAAYIAALPEQPILIGHSMGGLVVQKLINMGMGAMGICIDSAPPKGIRSFQWSFLRANFSTIDPTKGNSICLPSVQWFHYAFCNTLTIAQTQKEYTQFVVPESRNIPRSSIGRDGEIDFKKPHAPLLFIAGEKDNIIPAKLNRNNAESYRDTKSTCDFVEFPYRTHYICSMSGWQEVASTTYQWIVQKNEVGFFQ
ncbi:MAG: alpha/beta hydrolase [Candidatus Kerfeldbacteria bacterium]|nr:alpha/beta hydrolase [Candidatus Kerfeldbacteria bacterium]